MIYIFDDRSERCKSNMPTIEKYSNIIKLSQINIDSSKSLNEYILNTYYDATCIIFHRSYVFKSNEITLNSIKTIVLEELNIPFVCFSGGIEHGNIHNNKDIEINAEIMYSNLDSFLKHHQTHSDISNFNAEILLWGDNYKLNQLLNIQNIIAEEYFLTVNIEDTIEDLEIVKRKIIRLLEKSFPNIMKSIIKGIEDIQTKQRNIRWIDFRGILQENINREKIEL